ncbi:MAG: cell division protein FtsA, partial [Kiritimatiellae bacterium]|nr:cell division protein FtsA [Kiritimatiellia bacterium]
ESEPGERLKVAAIAGIPSSGVRKSQICDINQVTQSIRSVVREVEKRQSDAGNTVSIGNTLLVVSGQHIKLSRYQGEALVGGKKVGNAEIEEVLHASRQMKLPKERELLDIYEQDYELDGRGGIASPGGMAGMVLRLNTLQAHAERNRLEDARTAAEAAAHIEISEPLFAATCAADAVLEDAEKRNGALVVDLGGGSTGYAVYCDGYLVSARVIGVGGDHVTNDIAYAFQTTQSQAEEIKIRESSATIGHDAGATERVKLPGSALTETRSISRRALDTVVNSRLKELFSIIREDLEDLDMLHRLHSGIVITGGGAAQRNVDVLLQRELGMPVRPGRPLYVDGLDGIDGENTFTPAYASICGALMYDRRNNETNSPISDLIRRFFK